MNNKNIWLALGLLEVILSAPNAAIIKVALGEADPLFFAASRALPIGLILLPFLLSQRKKLFVASARNYVITSAVYMTIAVVCYIYAIDLSQASYVSIVLLLGPITLIALSNYLLKDAITRRAVAGITLAALGAMLLVVLPIALSSGDVHFYPLATILALGNVLFFALAIIQMRRANEIATIPVTSLMGMNSLLVGVVCGGLFCFVGDTSLTPIGDVGFWVSVVYSGFIVGFISRILMVKVYEKVKGVTIGALEYVHMLLAILIPVFVLHESLSITMVVGGIMILLGLYVVERHEVPHTRYHKFGRHHH